MKELIRMLELLDGNETKEIEIATGLHELTTVMDSAKRLAKIKRRDI